MRRTCRMKPRVGLVFAALMVCALPGHAMDTNSPAPPTESEIALPTATPIPLPGEKTFAFLNEFEDRLAGVVWMAEGETAADSLADTPVGRLLAKVRLTGVVADITRWIGGLPLPAETWKSILQGHVLFLWIHPPEYSQMALSSDAAASDTPGSMPRFAVVVEPPAGLRRELARRMTTEGFLAARKRNPDLVATRKRVGGEIMHVWERVARDGKRRCVLAFASHDDKIILAADERIPMEILLRPRAAGKASPPAPPPPLQEAVRATLRQAVSEQSPFAAVMDVRAFPLFRSRAWWSKGLDLERVGSLMQSLEAEKSGTGAVLRKLHEGWDQLAEHAPRGGPADLRRIEVVYRPDPELPRSRIRLVFEPRARVWAGQFQSTREFALVNLAPTDCVRYWAMRLPSTYFGEPGGKEGAEFGQFLIPTRFRIAAVWMVEAKSVTHFVYDKTGISQDWTTSRGVELVANPPNIGPWPKVRGLFRKIEPWLPLVGMPWRVRFVGDYVAFSRSIEAIEKVSATGRWSAPSLGTAREDLFRRIDEHHRAGGGEPPVVIFERFTDFGRHAASIRAGDIFALPSADDTGGESLPFDVDWTTLLRVVPQVRGLLERLPPHHTWVIWHPDEHTLEIETVSASGLPGDPAVWISTGFSLLPTFKKE